MGRVRLPLVVAGSIFAVYLVAARLVGNLYPLSTFEMYSRPVPAWVTRIWARDATGALHRLDDYDEWRCEPAIDLRAALERCGPEHVALDYVVRGEQVVLDAGVGGDVSVDLISRAHRLANGPGERVRECVLARCSARRSDR